MGSGLMASTSPSWLPAHRSAERKATISRWKTNQPGASRLSWFIETPYRNEKDVRRFARPLPPADAAVTWQRLTLP